MRSGFRIEGLGRGIQGFGLGLGGLGCRVQGVTRARGLRSLSRFSLLFMPR